MTQQNVVNSGTDSKVWMREEIVSYESGDVAPNSCSGFSLFLK